MRQVKSAAACRHFGWNDDVRKPPDRLAV